MGVGQGGLYSKSQRLLPIQLLITNQRRKSMSALKNDLATVTKTLKQLSRKTEQLAKKVDRLEKAKAAKKPKAKKAAKAKTKRRVAAKRRTVTKKKAPKKRVAKKRVTKKRVAKKRVAKKRVTAKRPVARRSAKKSASEVILDLMSKSRAKKGVATALLQKQTGFNNQKIRDNIYKLTKRGKIKRVGRGVYAVK